MDKSGFTKIKSMVRKNKIKVYFFLELFRFKHVLPIFRDKRIKQIHNYSIARIKNKVV